MRKSNAKHEPANDAAGVPAAYMSADERRAAGKALRDATPRVAHGGWKSPEDRRDPVELLREANEGRIPELIPLRFSRMAQSPFAFYRGAAAVMAADLASTPTSGLPVQACGDAHLMNFGGFATPERNIFFDINDFDETLPAPWEWDVKRLAASIVIAARHIDLPDSAAAKAATEFCVLLPRTNDGLRLDARAGRLVRSHRSRPRSESPAVRSRGGAGEAKSSSRRAGKACLKACSRNWWSISARRQGSRTRRR